MIDLSQRSDEREGVEVGVARLTGPRGVRIRDNRNFSEQMSLITRPEVGRRVYSGLIGTSDGQEMDGIGGNSRVCRSASFGMLHLGTFGFARSGPRGKNLEPASRLPPSLQPSSSSPGLLSSPQ